MNTNYLDSRETALQRIIETAGALALTNFRQRPAGTFTLKGDQDFLTETDIQVEQIIREKIARSFPDDRIFGEESGGNCDDARALWVIDPIDGTANFARGIEHFCISIAFVHHGVTELGAILNPATGELYQARRDHYARKNSQPLHTAPTTAANCATLELGWSHRVPQPRYLEVMTGMLDAGANVRRGASGALALAWVAEGRTDGYVELHMNAWDCLAGLLLVREAGGMTGSYPDDVKAIVSGGPVLAAAPGIAAQIAHICRIRLADLPPEPTKKTAYPHPPLSLIVSQVPGWNFDLYIGGSTGAADLAELKKRGINTVINCAVNLDIDWVDMPAAADPALLRHGASPVRYYKLGLIDGPGNPPELLYAGYHQLRAALLQEMPDKPSYRNRIRGNVLINCRGGRSRSVSLVALFLYLECPQQFPTLEAAIAHIRSQRPLHPDEWFEAPKPEMVALAEHAIAMEAALVRAGLRPSREEKKVS